MTTAFEAAYHVGQARLRGGLPSTDARFTDAKLLKLLTDELQGNIAPLVHNAKSDHGVVQHTVAATVGTAEYALPSGAFAGTLRDVYWIDASSNITPLAPRSAADPLMYALGRNNGTPRYYYLRGSKVVVVPPPSAAGTIAMPHYARPGTLVLVGLAAVSNARAVACTTSSYNSVTGTLTLTVSGDPPTVLRGGVAGSMALDVVRASPGFERLFTTTQATTTIAEPSPDLWTYTITGFTSNPGVAAEDYICVPGESPVPQCPVELFPLLHARVALVAVPSTGDMSQAAAALAAQVADLEAKAVSFLRPRVESAQPPPGRGMGSNPLLDTISGSWSG
jgi:hypothetical protein